MLIMPSPIALIQSLSQFFVELVPSCVYSVFSVTTLDPSVWLNRAEKHFTTITSLHGSGATL